MELSPTQLHYYKRELISLELQRELDKLKQSPDVFALLKDDHTETKYPFLRYIAQQFVVKFPLLKHGGNDEFWNKCQTFLNELAKVKLDTYTPKRSSATQRRILMYKIQKLMNVGLAASIKTRQGDEQVIKVDPSELRKKEDSEVTKEMEKEMTFLENEDHYLEWIGFNGLDINVVTVRNTSEKRTLREVSHAEFVICTHFQDQPDPVFVGRRHGDFRRLYQDLRAEYPSEEVPGVPSKASDPSFENGENKQERKAFHRRPQELRHTHLYREKDRLLLRSFLRRVAAVPKLAKSDIFRRFLSENSIELTQEQLDDAEKRKELDLARYEEEARFREQVDQKMSELNELLSMLKKQVMKPGGLLEVFEIIKSTERIQDLPDPIRKGFEWGRINLAFVLHTQFITSDSASENVASLKRTHALMPYRAVAQILKVSNPFAMVKGVLDLFLAQPFGRRSLFQRIIMAGMSDEAKEVQQEIAELETQIQDPELCKKFRNAVETPLPENFSFQSRSSVGQTLEVLRNEDIEPALTPQQIVKLASATKEPENRKLVKQLHRLWTLYAAKREQEVLMALAFQGVTGELLREIFAMFYEPLAQVYKAANIGDSITHLSAFIDDLIGILDSVDVQDVSNTTQQFIQLVQRHEQQFYKFVHDVHANDSSRLFDELLQYVDCMFSLVANGIPGRVDMDQVATAAGVTDHEALKKEIDAICDYHWRRKAQHMQRTRQKLMMDQQQSQIDTEEAFDFLPNKSEVVGVFQDLAEFVAEDDELFDDDDDSTYSGSSGSKAPVAHELTLEPPQMELLPKVVPAFVKSVVGLLRANNQ